MGHIGSQYDVITLGRINNFERLKPLVKSSFETRYQSQVSSLDLVYFFICIHLNINGHIGSRHDVITLGTINNFELLKTRMKSLSETRYKYQVSTLHLVYFGIYKHLNIKGTLGPRVTPLYEKGLKISKF